jgi:eukaryotic-like serine/threonine-protein kinase
VGGTASNGYMDVSASRTGVLAYGTSKQGLQRLVWVDRSGRLSEGVSEPGFYNQIRTSPNGASALTDVSRGGRDVWRIDLERSNGATRLTFAGDGRSPVWSPDGREIAYVALTKGVFRKAASGAGEAVTLLATDSVLILDDWSSDGKFLLYRVIAANSSESGLWALPLEPGGTAGKPMPFIKGPSVNQSSARFSPGSGQRFVAYSTRESGSGALQVYVQDFPEAHSKWQISTDGGTRPMWSRDGKQLFFLSTSANKLMSAAVKIAGSSFTNTKPEPLFESASLREQPPYDVSPDGKRFLFATPDEQNRRLNPITLVQNWQTGLK